MFTENVIHINGEPVSIRFYALNRKPEHGSVFAIEAAERWEAPLPQVAVKSYKDAVRWIQKNCKRVFKPYSFEEVWKIGEKDYFYEELNIKELELWTPEERMDKSVTRKGTLKELKG